MAEENISQSAEMESSRELQEREPIYGEYSDMYFGDPSIHGHVDAPHAEAVSSGEIRKLVYGGKRKTRDGRLVVPDSQTIYANLRVRRLLLCKNDRKRVPDSGTVTVKIGNRRVTYKVKKGRRGADGKRKSVIVRPEYVDEVVEVLRKKAASDARTGQIAEQVNDKGVTVIIGRRNRHIVDINRYRNYRKCGLGELDPKGQNKAVREYRRHKKTGLEHTDNIDEEDKAEVPHLHIALHGKEDMKAGNPRDSDIEVGTVNGQSCDLKIRDWFADRLEEELRKREIRLKGKAPKILKDVRQSGHISKNMGPIVHGENYQTIQLEVCRTLRFKHGEVLAEILTILLREFDEKYSQPALKGGKAEGTRAETKKAIEEVIDRSEEPEEVPEGLPENLVHKLVVRKASREMAGKAKIAISPEVADEMEVDDGTYISIVVGKRNVVYMEVVVRGNLGKNVILMDKLTRESLGVKEGDEEEFNFGIH